MRNKPLIPIATFVVLALCAVPASGMPDPGAGTAGRTDRPVARTPISPVGSGAGESEHVRDSAVPVSKRPPRSAGTEVTRQSYDAPSRATPSRATPSTAECNVEDFASSTGSALIELIGSSTTECISTLFSVTGGNARALFVEEKMITVADGFAANAGSYPGDNSTGTAQLVLYLRAGYYVQWNHPDDVGPYGPELASATRAGLDAFFADPDSSIVSDENGISLSEAVILIDSAGQNAHYLHVVKRLLDDYDSSYDSSWYMLNSVNAVYTVLFRGHWLPEFVQAVQADPSVLDTVHGFAVEHLDLLGTERRYLTTNAGRELGRFLQHEQLRDRVRPQAKDLLGRSRIVGETAPLWVGVAEMADYYDQPNCEYYDVCDLQQRLEDAALTIDHDCGATIDIRAQEAAGGELDDACQSMGGQDAFFHDLVGDSGPVEGDKNDTLEVVVFNSSTDYQTYAGAIFGIDTNNGGMYLEGDPSADGNQARFIAYEAEWLPSFAIWNLNHEYTHYLDGRFDMQGDFGDNISTPTVWWLEGLAEYVSYSYRGIDNDDAIAEAAKGTYDLSALFDTTYDHDSTRVYPWGYLAVRYMFEVHRSDIDTILGSYRSGDWASARDFLDSTIGSTYDQNWRDWLGALQPAA